MGRPPGGPSSRLRDGPDLEHASVMTAVSTANASSRTSGLGWWRTRQLQGVLYALPTAIIVVVFFITPILVVAWISGHQWPLFTGQGEANLPTNYTEIGRNRLFVGAVSFTIIYTILVTAMLIGLGLGLALLVQGRGRWTGILRTAILLPVAVGLAAASLLAWGLYSPAIGPINPILMRLGVIDDPIQFFLTPLSALLSVCFLIVWKYVGLYMLILLVGLQAIPDEVLEAAAIDGANRWQQFRRVTLPLLRPSLALALILAITGSLLAFDQFFILTKGQPDNSTVTVVQLIYFEAFSRLNMGTAAALSIVVLVALLILGAIQFRALRVGRES
jgi:multiple sugar transport system permease protein